MFRSVFSLSPMQPEADTLQTSGSCKDDTTMKEDKQNGAEDKSQVDAEA